MKLTLTNYWWLIIWLFGAGTFCYLTVPRRKERLLGETVYRSRWVEVLVIALPFVLWAAFRTLSFGDSGAYQRKFLNAPSAVSQIPAYISENTKDKGYSVFMIFCKSFIGNTYQTFFLLIAAIQMFAVVRLFRRYSENFWFCFMMFILSTDYMSWMFNGIRQFLACCMILSGFDLIIRKKYVPSALLILLASTIHGSALIMLPVIFIIQGRAWNKKTLLFILTMGVMIYFIDSFTPFLTELLSDTQYDDITTNEIWKNDNGTNIIRALVYSAPALLAFVGRKWVHAENDPVMNMSVNCAIITACLYALSVVSSGEYIGRLPIYTTLIDYMCVPWLIDRMFAGDSAKLVKTVVVGLFLGFFYYQMHFTWGLL